MAGDNQDDEFRAGDALRRFLGAGWEKLGDRPDQLKQRILESKLPKEAWAAIWAQMDDRKSGLYRLVSREVRDLLQNTDFAEDLVRALTKLSFEIKTEVRFVPNDAGGAKPRVRAGMRVKNDSEHPGADDDDGASDDGWPEDQTTPDLERPASPHGDKPRPEPGKPATTS